LRRLQYKEKTQKERQGQPLRGGNALLQSIDRFSLGVTPGEAEYTTICIPGGVGTPNEKKRPNHFWGGSQKGKEGAWGGMPDNW